MRTGTLAQKLGMTRVYDDGGRAVPVTVLRMDDVEVVARREPESDGYAAVQLGAGAARAKRTSKGMRGHFAKAGVAPKRALAEFRVEAGNLAPVGAKITAAHFGAGQFVDVSGTTIGKGFAGAMKRHGFAGLRASHGVSVAHRSHGSTGQCQDPGRVFKGKKMAGQYGGARATVQNLEVVRSDPERGILMVKGAVPGASGGWVEVRDAIKKPAPDLPAFPPAQVAPPATAAGDEGPGANDAPAPDGGDGPTAADGGEG